MTTSKLRDLVSIGVMVLFGILLIIVILIDHTAKTPNEIPFDAITSLATQNLPTFKGSLQKEYPHQSAAIENATIGEPTVTYRFDLSRMANDNYLTADFETLLEKTTVVVVPILVGNQQLLSVGYTEKRGTWQQVYASSSFDLFLTKNRDTLNNLKFQGKTVIIRLRLEGSFVLAQQGDQLLLYPMYDFRGLPAVQNGKLQGYRIEEILPLLHEAAKDYTRPPPISFPSFTFNPIPTVIPTSSVPPVVVTPPPFGAYPPPAEVYPTPERAYPQP